MSNHRKCLRCHSKGDLNISLFSFPSEDSVRKKWAEFCGVGLEDLKITHRLCSQHFPASSFKTPDIPGKKKLLVDGAVPSIIKKCSSNDTDSLGWNRPPKYRKVPGRRTVGHKTSCRICGIVENSVPRFSFPKDPPALQVWLDACGMKQTDLRRWYALCEAHFQPTEVIRPEWPYRRYALMKGAVPTRLLPSHLNNEGNVSNASVNPVDETSTSSSDHDGSVEFIFDYGVDSEGEREDVTSPQPRKYMSLSDHDKDALPLDSSVSLAAPVNEQQDVESCSIPSATRVTPSLNSGDARLSHGLSYTMPIDDVFTPQCAGCERARIILDVARKGMATARRKNEKLRSENYRLKLKVESLSVRLDELKLRNLLKEEARMSTKEN